MSYLRRGIRDTLLNLRVQAERAALVVERKYPHAYPPCPGREGGSERGAQLTTAARTAAESVAHRRPTGDAPS